MHDGKDKAKTYNVVPFRRSEGLPVNAIDLWGQFLSALYVCDLKLVATWFRHLREVDREGGIVMLHAPARLNCHRHERTETGRLHAF